MSDNKYKEFHKNKKSLKDQRNKSRGKKFSGNSNFSDFNEDSIAEGIYDDVKTGKIKNLEDISTKNKDLNKDLNKETQDTENKEKELEEPEDEFNDAYFEPVQYK